jgi:hypothetical protein
MVFLMPVACKRAFSSNTLHSYVGRAIFDHAFPWLIAEILFLIYVTFYNVNPITIFLGL